MGELAEGWKLLPLEQLLTHVIGGDWGIDAESTDADYLAVRCIRGSEFKSWGNNLGSTAVTRRIKASSLENRRLAPGDLLLEISGGGPDQPVGRVVLITDDVLAKHELPVVCTNFLRLMRPAASVHPAYLYYFLSYFYHSGEVTSYQGGSNNLRNLKFKEYSLISIPVAAYAEQKAIADKLDTLLAQVETTKARLERIPDILKRFRQSVLAAAVSGRLTEGWREDSGSPFPYDVRPLAEVILEMRNGLSPKPNEEERGHPVLRISSVRPFFLDQEDVRYLETSKEDEARYALRVNDVLFTRYNGSLEFVGVCARVRSLRHETLLYPDKLIRVRVDAGKIAPGYLELFSASQLAREYILTLIKSTSGQKGISGKDLKQMAVQLPAREEQTEIVRRVDELFAHADRIERQAQAALERVNKLTQSILAKAFRGELTEQWRRDHPELISGENSAAALLERIKAERAASIKPKARKSKA